jgi:hypothetical protein
MATPSPTTFPCSISRATYRRLVSEQTNLGWHQLFNGRWSTEWARLQDGYLLHHHDPIPEKLRVNCGPLYTLTFSGLVSAHYGTLKMAKFMELIPLHKPKPVKIRLIENYEPYIHYERTCAIVIATSSTHRRSTYCSTTPVGNT